MYWATIRPFYSMRQGHVVHYAHMVHANGAASIIPAFARDVAMRPTIVVVEDEPHIHELLRDVLESDGYSVVSILHPFGACVLDPAKSADLILVDLLLPDRSGLNLARHLRDHGFAHTPIMAMSADRVMLKLAATSGLFQMTIGKPFDLDALLAHVRRYAGLYVA